MWACPGRYEILLFESLVSDSMVSAVRRELRRVHPDAKIEVNQVLEVLLADVIKREALEGDKAAAAKRAVSRSASRALRDIGDHHAATGPDEATA